MKHTIQALVENKFGVLSRVSSLFSARGYNIDSLTVGETHDPLMSCMTIVVNAEDERTLEQIKKQLNKLIDVITVVDFTHRDYLDRELLLIKIAKKDELSRAAVAQAVKTEGCRIIEDRQDYYIIELCAGHSVVEEVLKELKSADISELVRTGKIAMGKE
jgi:acetolactate synthase I/III small subunit